MYNGLTAAFSGIHIYDVYNECMSVYVYTHVYECIKYIHIHLPCMLPLPPPTPPDTYRQMRPQTHRRHILLRRATPPSSSRETADRSADRSASCRSRRRSRRGQQWRSRGSRSRRRRRSCLRLCQRLILRRSVHGALRRASECVHTGDDVSDVVMRLTHVPVQSPSK